MIEAPPATPPDRRTTSFPDLLEERRSVRAFLSDPVPREVIMGAIRAAGWAPSPHNSQPWRFVVIESAERRTALAEAMAADWRRQLELDGQGEATVEIRLEKGKSRLIEAPVLVLGCLYLADLEQYPDLDRQQAEVTMAIQSLGAAIQNLLLWIHQEGFDAGWMCAPLFCPEIVQTALGLSESLIPHALMPVGRAARDPIRKPRRSVETLIAAWQ